MTSPQKRLLEQLRSKRANREKYLPQANIPIGKKFPISKITTAKTNYKKNDEGVFTMVPHFTINGSRVFSYMTGIFQDTDQQKVEDQAEAFNAGIDSKESPLWLVYYGVEVNSHVVDFLAEDEEIDRDLMSRCRSEASTSSSPAKKPKTE